jgi:hypothetical protein
MAWNELPAGEPGREAADVPTAAPGPCKQAGVVRGHLSEIKQHPFFHGINWMGSRPGRHAPQAGSGWGDGGSPAMQLQETAAADAHTDMFWEARRGFEWNEATKCVIKTK